MQVVQQSICAFLNRSGGQVVLRVADDGTITGIKEDALDQMKKDMVTGLNNPQKLNPPLYILPEEIEIDGNLLLFLNIPKSSQVHRPHPAGKKTCQSSTAGSSLGRTG
jgi:ATP-dependent DNA helicase RecG